MATPGPKQSKLVTSQVIEAISARTVLPKETVRLVIDTFAEVVRDALLRELGVVINNFGKFSARQGKTGLLIRFKAATDLRETLKESLTPMDKYGVEIKNEDKLVAKLTGQCPECKSELDQKDPPHCPNCGTKPFEAKKENP